MSDSAFLLAIPPTQRPAMQIEVCRSFSYKLNLKNYGGPDYESEDFFSSKKMMVPFEEREVWSELLYQECVAEVAAAVNAVKRKLAEQHKNRIARPPAGSTSARNFEAWEKRQGTA